MHDQAVRANASTRREFPRPISSKIERTHDEQRRRDSSDILPLAGDVEVDDGSLVVLHLGLLEFEKTG